MNKGVAASELLMLLGRGDEENNNLEVAKKRTTLTENSAGGNVDIPPVSETYHQSPDSSAF